jgi:hypothetical protein
MSRPAHEPTEEGRRTVKAMAAFGIPHIDIARALGISAPTLRRHYRGELQTGQTVATAKVAQNLFRIATGDGRGAVQAAIFWLKCRAGWRDTTVDDAMPSRRLGKKERAELESRTAGEGTEWEDLLTTPLVART